MSGENTTSKRNDSDEANRPAPASTFEVLSLIHI